MLRALALASLLSTAICGVKGAPRPPERDGLAGDAGVPQGALAPDATELDPAHDPLAVDAGCEQIPRTPNGAPGGSPDGAGEALPSRADAGASR